MIRRHARTLTPIAALAIGAGFGTAVHSGTAAAETTDVVRSGATDDTYSSSSRPSYNFGSSDTLVAGRNGGDTMVTFLKFTVAAPGAGATVKGAKVTLTTASRTLPGSISLSRVASTTWTEKTLSARNNPAVGAVVSTVRPASGAATVTFDVSSVVKGAGTYAFAVSSTVPNSPARFRSAEASDGRPALNVTVSRATNPPPVESSASTNPPSSPPATSPAPTAPGACAVDAKLVPSCGVLWGAAAGGYKLKSSTSNDGKPFVTTTYTVDLSGKATAPGPCRSRTCSRVTPAGRPAGPSPSDPPDPPRTRTTQALAGPRRGPADVAANPANHPQ